MIAGFGTLTGAVPDGRSAGSGLAADQAREVFASYPSGVAALCAQTAQGPVGFVVTSFTAGVSYDPPMVAFSAQNSSRTWQALRGARRIGVSVLGDAQQKACRQLASRTGDRFANLPHHVTGSGAVLLEDSPLRMDCQVLSETPAGDHQVVLLQVHGAQVQEHLSPMVYRSRSFHHIIAAG
ncbi:flavin reductase family protein [Nesterenkonia sp. CF4.4]|uniref:flavin reductase family protein n=1 Tax=Nesterenkonia sp. CF4.4 TaxID=3373079 RepID=UPI003EE60843